MISFASEEGLCVAAGIHVKYDSQLLLACLSLPLEANAIIHDKNKQIRCCDCVNIIQIALIEGTLSNVLHIYSLM
jgi:hypothetical protein